MIGGFGGKAIWKKQTDENRNRPPHRVMKLEFKRRSINLRVIHPGGEMTYKINYTELALENLRSFRAFEQGLIKEAIDTHLKHEPKKESRSRIKRLRGFEQPEYRLRVGDEIRVIYDVSVEHVTIHAIVRKEDVDQWLLKYGIKS